jgi:predicted RNA-binding Zn ribbon-like protein
MIDHVTGYTHYAMAVPEMPRTADGHALRFRAGRPSLDLCSTLLWRYRAPTELLRNPADLVRWIAEAGLAPVPRTADQHALNSALRLREAIYRAAHAHVQAEAPAARDLATLNRLAAKPVAVPHIGTRRGLTWTAADPVAAALSAIARDAIALLTDPLADRLRECAAPDCAFLFLDSSRAGNRRWCATNRCGNRQRVRNHRARANPGA